MDLRVGMRGVAPSLLPGGEEGVERAWGSTQTGKKRIGPRSKEPELRYKNWLRNRVGGAGMAI